MAGVTAPAYRLAEVAAVLGARRADGVRTGAPGPLGEGPGSVDGDDPDRARRSSRPARERRTGADERIRLPRVASRAYASLVHPTGEGPDVDVRTGGDAVRLPLPGGWVATVWGTELHRVPRTVEGLDPRTVARVAA